MKKIFKKGLCIILSLLIAVIAIPALTVSAADTGKKISGGLSFYFTDNQGWGSVYVYAWNESGDVTSAWPGNPCSSEVNGYGETYFTIDVPDGATGCVVNNGKGAQTSDITDFSVEGYYTDGSKNDNGHFIAIPWLSSYKVTENTTYDEPTDASVIFGTNTVFLNPGDFAYDGEWYAYTWGVGSGRWVSGVMSNGRYSFSDIDDCVIFASASDYPDDDWSNITAQTNDFSVMDGDEYFITGKREADTYGWGINSFYVGYWNSEYPNNPPTYPVTDPVTDPVTEPDTTKAPEQLTTEAYEDTTAAPEPETGLKLTTALNGSPINTIDCKGTTVTVTYNMQAPMLLEDGQGTLKYDASKLQITSFTLPNVTEGLIANYKVPGEAYFNFTGVDSMTESGKFNFKDNKALVVATFNVVGTGATTVNLDMEELDGYENGQQVSYYTNKAASAQAATITESLKKVTVYSGDINTEPYEPTTDVPTEAPTQGGYNQPTQAYTIAPVTKPVTMPSIAAPTSPGNKTTIKKINISKWKVIGIKNKTYNGKKQKQKFVVTNGKSVADIDTTYYNNINVGTATIAITGKGDYIGTIFKTFKINKAKQPMKVKVYKKTVRTKSLKKKASVIKPITVRKAKGKVIYSKYKKGSTIMTYKRLSVNKKTGKITIKKNYYPKGTFKISVKITAKGNKNYKSKSVVKTISIKVK